MVPIPSILEMTGIRPITELAEAVFFTVAAGIRINIALPHLSADLAQQFIDIRSKLAQLRR